MIELVDGHAGKAHISSEDMAALNQGIVGEADCVFGYADGLKCSMQTANKASVGKGAGMVGGRRFWVKSAETVSIDSGAPGVKRNDLIVARYKAEPSGVESVSLEVVKGSPSPSAPTDPDAGPDALKLWRIPLDGISAGEPQPLFKAVPSLASLRDSLSRRPWVCSGKTGGSGSLGEYHVNLTPPPWAADRKPDAVLCEPMVLGNEELAKLFYATVWSIDSSRYMQLRLWRRDKNSFAADQGVSCSWVAIWNP